ncbi:MAG TPA: hypothetical protein VKV30_16090 [Candidatus Angelobacter sp.]|nr:hypothetical protein [Candidatus Angelobacter sp.]
MKVATRAMDVTGAYPLSGYSPEITVPHGVPCCSDAFAVLRAFRISVVKIPAPLIDPAFLCHNLHIPTLGDTHLTERKETILVASWNPVLADLRKTILEKEGFAVLEAKGSAGVRALCKKKKVDLVLIGYSLPPSEKRKVWAEARRVCKTPILQLFQGAEPELIESNAFAHEAQTPDDFVKSIRSVLRRLNN